MENKELELRPLVSVVIPTYKRPDMLVRAIRSVLNQTYKPIEIIVVDDNGKNLEEQLRTEALIQDFKEVISYIVHEKNKGGSAARNTGWREAKGKYITYLDDDDEINSEKISEQVKCLEALDDSWGACYTAYHIQHPNGFVQKSATNQQGDVYLRALMRTFYMGSGSNVLYKKDIVDLVGGYDETFKRNQDIEFMTRCFEKCNVAYVDKDLLTVHLEIREFKRTFKFLDDVTEFYLDKFQDRINLLNTRDKHRVISVITLDRVRIAVMYHEFKYSIRLLKNNHVKIGEIISYIIYLVKRYLTKQSYGFYLE